MPVTISRFLLGALFLFSGAAKAINPFGLSIQISDYLVALGLEFLLPLSLSLAITLPVVEMLLGALLLMRVYMKQVIWIVTLFMSFFTLLTLWIAIYNPVKDCGCFGDLLKISNWSTFVKNIIFLVPTILLFVNRNRAKSSKFSSFLRVAFLAWGFFILPFATIFSLPIVDSTPYKLETNLYEALHDGTPDITKTTLLYKNIASGDIKEFEIEDEEWQDETKWEFADAKTVVVEPGVPPTIKSLPMLDANGVDRADEILQLDGRILLIVVQEPSKVQNEIESLIANYSVKEPELKVVMLHSSVAPTSLTTEIESYVSDQTVIRTMIQNMNGGYLLLDNGIVTLKSVL